MILFELYKLEKLWDISALGFLKQEPEKLIQNLLSFFQLSLRVYAEDGLFWKVFELDISRFHHVVKFMELAKPPGYNVGHVLRLDCDPVDKVLLPALGGQATKNALTSSTLSNLEISI